jgi:hypothetical protein
MSETPATVTYALAIVGAEGEQLFAIACDGRVFWRRREIETDDELRAALTEAAATLLACANAAAGFPLRPKGA